MLKEQFDQGTPEQIEKAQKEMGVLQAWDSSSRETDYKRLSPQQLEILKQCSLSLVENKKDRMSVVSGTIEDGRSIEMIEDWKQERISIIVKIDGNIISDKNERIGLVNKYWPIARASSEMRLRLE